MSALPPLTLEFFPTLLFTHHTISILSFLYGIFQNGKLIRYGFTVFTRKHFCLET